MTWLSIAIGNSLLPVQITWVLIGLFLISILINYRLINDYLYMRRNVPEALVFLNARQQRKDVSMVIDNANVADMYVTTKVDKGDVEFDDKGKLGVQIDPAVLSGVEAIRTRSGISIWEYPVNFYFPVGNKGKRGILSIVDHVRKEHPDLNFIHNDLVVIELLHYPANHLEYNCKKIVKGYLDIDDVEEIKERASELVEEIEQIKSEVPTLKLKSGFYSSRKALNAIPIGSTAPDIARIIKVVKNMAEHSGWDDIPKWLVGSCMIMAGFVVVLVVAYKFMGP